MGCLGGARRESKMVRPAYPPSCHRRELQNNREKKRSKAVCCLLREENLVSVVVDVSCTLEEMRLYSLVYLN